MASRRITCCVRQPRPWHSGAGLHRGSRQSGV